MEQSPYISPINQPQTVSKSSAGPVIGAIIVIIILALGGLYFWGAQLNNKAADELPFIPGDDPSAMNEEGAWMPLSSQSDEAAAIEADLQTTNMDAFEQQMNADLSATESSF